MALVPLATKGNYFHVYDFRVKPGTGDEFIELFNKFDYGDNNPVHRSAAQVKDGVLCRDAGGSVSRCSAIASALGISSSGSTRRLRNPTS